MTKPQDGVKVSSTRDTHVHEPRARYSYVDQALILKFLLRIGYIIAIWVSIVAIVLSSRLGRIYISRFFVRNSRDDTYR